MRPGSYLNVRQNNRSKSLGLAPLRTGTTRSMGKYYSNHGRPVRGRAAAAITTILIAAMLGFNIYLIYFSPSPVKKLHLVTGDEAIATTGIVYKLIIPPIMKGSGPEWANMRAPLSKWDVVDQFDSERACGEKRLALVRYGSSGLNGPSTFTTRESAALCIRERGDINSISQHGVATNK